MKTLDEYRECPGCDHEVWECYVHQRMGYHSGLHFEEEHLSFFVIDPITNKFIVPIHETGMV